MLNLNLYSIKLKIRSRYVKPNRLYKCKIKFIDKNFTLYCCIWYKNVLPL